MQKNQIETFIRIHGHSLKTTIFELAMRDAVSNPELWKEEHAAADELSSLFHFIDELQTLENADYEARAIILAADFRSLLNCVIEKRVTSRNISSLQMLKVLTLIDIISSAILDVVSELNSIREENTLHDISNLFNEIKEKSNQL